MKLFILSLLFASPLAASAQTYNMQLGQNAQLNAGDVVFVSNGVQSSAISCGGQQQPTFRDFPLRQTINLSQDFQGRPEDNARALCEQGIDYTISQTALKLVKDATNDCLRGGFSTCKQVGQTEYELVPKAANNNFWGCHIQVTVRGQ
jgi:hypothetical protein